MLATVVASINKAGLMGAVLMERDCVLMRRMLLVLTAAMVMALVV